MRPTNKMNEHMSISNVSDYIKGLCLLTMKCFNDDLHGDAETFEAYDRDTDILYPIVEDEIELEIEL